MSTQSQFSEEAMERARELGRKFDEAIVNGLKKAKELVIEDMTTLEAEAYLKKQEEEKKKQEEEKKK